MGVSRSVVSDSAIPRTVACQAPLPMEFSRKEYWSGLLFPSPGDLSDPGIKPPHCRQILYRLSQDGRVCKYNCEGLKECTMRKLKQGWRLPSSRRVQEVEGERQQETENRVGGSQGRTRFT